MSKAEWAVFAGIVGVVVIGIAVESDHEEMAGHDQAAMVVEAAPNSHMVTLAVTGMT